MIGFHCCHALCFLLQTITGAMNTIDPPVELAQPGNQTSLHYIQTIASQPDFLFCPVSDFWSVDEFRSVDEFWMNFGQWINFGQWMNFGQWISFGQWINFGQWVNLSSRSFLSMSDHPTSDTWSLYSLSLEHN